MNKNVAPVFITTLLLFAGLKLFSLVYRLSTDLGGVVVLTIESIVTWGLALVAMGIFCGIIYRQLASEPSDEEITKVGFGVFGLTLFSGICFGGGCLPAAVMGSVFTVPLLLPALLGIKCAHFFKTSYRKDTDG